jgi:phosphatidylserine/phosphatidylglycerophosphate/cardiolipin synthase-like enzyme
VAGAVAARILFRALGGRIVTDMIDLEPTSDVPTAQAGPAPLPARGILQAPRNCWRIERAERARVLIDGASYFSGVEQALQQARRSILIIGWDFDGRIKLSRGPGQDGQALGDLLRSLVETRPELEVRILVWSIAIFHAPSAALPLIWGDAWQEHPRIKLRLDKTHPIYGAHHDKLVCIDDSLAFAGGIDLTIDRWDTSSHDPDDPERADPDGRPYPPVHDMQMAVAGDAADALASIARHRWYQATGEQLEPIRGAEPFWPDRTGWDFEDVDVAIARTVPGWRGAQAIHESWALTVDALKAARRCIYIETQYLADTAVGDLLAQRLAEPHGPEVVLVLTKAFEGVVERWVMGANRDRLLRRLQQADRFGRLRACYPVVPGKEGEGDVLIHSKLMIIDDDFLRIGSSNLNNRSVGLDTECDLAIEAANEATRARIAGLRSRLLGEHLGRPAEVVADTTAAEGSVVRAIDALNHGERGLRCFQAMGTNGPTHPVFGTWLLDPRRPFRPLWLLRRQKRAGP